MLSLDQVPSQIEQITHRSMGTQKPLSLPYRFELSHPSLSHPGRLMRLLGPIILVLLSAVGCRESSSALVRSSVLTSPYDSLTY